MAIYPQGTVLPMNSTCLPGKDSANVELQCIIEYGGVVYHQMEKDSQSPGT